MSADDDDRAGLPPLDRRLAAADRMASMGVLAAGLAHEINNPLTYASMTIRTLAERLEAADDAERMRGELQEGLRTALDGCERMRVILHDLLTFARKGRPAELAPVDLCGVLDTAISMAQNEIRHRARLVRSYSGPSLVQGDETRLGQLFLNLLTNAAHAIPTGSADRNAITVAVQARDEEMVTVEVHDTGVGIEEANLPRIFEPFFTTKGESLGTGLGLSICREIAEDHGGTISVRSAPGEGTTFTVTLPQTRRELTPAVPTTSMPSIELRARLLLVDDELRLARAISQHLALVAPNVVIVVVDGGRTALELLDRDAAFDVILCDLMMPRTSGMDVHGAIARRHPELLSRFVVMTGGAFTERARAFLETPGLEVLYKPFTTEELLDAVSRVLSSGG